MNSVSRRSFLAASAAAAGIATAADPIPVGLELYSVRGEFARNPQGTLRAVAAMGYPIVEFYAPYFDWPPAQAREMRKLMDDLGLRCHSTHNNQPSFTAEGLPKAIELNRILGSKYIVMASAGTVNGIDGWKRVAAQLTAIAAKLKPAGMDAGYHNHQPEFQAIGGERPMDILAAGTPKEVMLQFDVGTCLEAGADPVAWIEANPGRIRSLHCKDWSPGAGKGYRVLLGEGVAQWKKIRAAAESVGGVEYYLIEQEGSRFPELETAKRCLEAWKRIAA